MTVQRTSHSPSPLLQKHHQFKAQTLRLVKSKVLETLTETQQVNMLRSKRQLGVKHPIADPLPHFRQFMLFWLCYG